MLIYQIINKINGKSYIGKTINLKNRIYGHKKSAERGSNYHFHNAIRKYGFNSFKLNILEYCKDKKELNEREIYYIKIYKPEYNMTSGGDGGPIRSGSNNGMSKYKGMSYEQIYGHKKAKEKKKNISGGLKRLGKDHPSKRSDVKEKLKKTHKKREKMIDLKDNHPMRRPECVAKNNLSKIKEWIICSPDNQIFKIKNMKEFCLKNNLNNSQMTLVSQGKRNNHKGWKCKKLNNEDKKEIDNIIIQMAK